MKVLLVNGGPHKAGCTNRALQEVAYTLIKEGIDTEIYQGGKNLSGGQRQRLAIARAISKNSDILILDDSKSALDFKTSKLLTDEIKKINKTVIEISQRASDMMHCDLVLVLDKGEMVGLGSHDELIKTCDVYKEICESQDVNRRDSNEK